MRRRGTGDGGGMRGARVKLGEAMHSCADGQTLTAKRSRPRTHGEGRFCVIPCKTGIGTPFVSQFASAAKAIAAADRMLLWASLPPRALSDLTEPREVPLIG